MKSLRIGAHLGDGSVSPANLVRVAEGRGFTAFQMFVGQQTNYYPYQYSPQQIQEFQSEKARTNMLVAAHGCYIANLCHTGSQNRWRRSVASVVDQLRCCDRLGVDFLIMHVGSPKEQTEEEGRQNLFSAVEAALAEAKPTHTTLLLENTAGGGKQPHMEALVHVVAQAEQAGIDKIGICLDTAHAWADGWDIPNVAERSLLLAQCAPYVKWVHYNNPDAKVERGSHLDRHREAWDSAKWPIDVMQRLAEEWGVGALLPLCMEADSRAYELNWMFLEEAGLV